MPKGSNRQGKKPPRRGVQHVSPQWIIKLKFFAHIQKRCPSHLIIKAELVVLHHSVHFCLYIHTNGEPTTMLKYAVYAKLCSFGLISPYFQYRYHYQAFYTPPHVYHTPLQMYQPQSSQSSPRIQTQSHSFNSFLSGNIHTCKGCRGTSRLPDGSIPNLPNNIVVACLERRPYFDRNSGDWCSPRRKTSSYNHFKLSCVVKADPCLYLHVAHCHCHQMQLKSLPLITWSWLQLNLA